MAALARRRLAGDALALRGLLDALDTRFLEGDALRAVDPDGTALTNVNTPEEAARAEPLLATGPIVGKHFYGKTFPIVNIAAGDFPIVSTGAFAEVESRPAGACIRISEG